MPTRSRNERTRARQKRTMSLVKKSLRTAAFEANRHFSTVLMLLAQSGGEAVVTSETIRDVIPTLRTTEYRTENTDGGVRILLVKPILETTTDIQDPAVPTWTPPARSAAQQLRETRDAQSETIGYVEVEADAPSVAPTVEAGAA